MFKFALALLAFAGIAAAHNTVLILTTDEADVAGLRDKLVTDGYSTSAEACTLKVTTLGANEMFNPATEEHIGHVDDLSYWEVIVVNQAENMPFFNGNDGFGQILVDYINGGGRVVTTGYSHALWQTETEHGNAFGGVLTDYLPLTQTRYGNPEFPGEAGRFLSNQALENGGCSNYADAWITEGATSGSALAACNVEFGIPRLAAGATAFWSTCAIPGEVEIPVKEHDPEWRPAPEAGRSVGKGPNPRLIGAINAQQSVVSLNLPLSCGQLDIVCNAIEGPQTCENRCELQGCLPNCVQFNGHNEDRFVNTHECLPDFCQFCADTNADSIKGCARVAGDPHFVGYDGNVFDVQGEAGDILNLISDSGFQFNAKYAAGCRANGNVIGEFGLLIGEHRIAMRAAPKDADVHKFGFELMLDAEELTLEDRKISLGEDSYMVLRSFNPEHDRSVKKFFPVEIVSPDYTLFLTDRESRCGVHHLDVHVSFRNPNARPHGLLGQTETLAREGKRSDGSAFKPTKEGFRYANGEGTIEGNVEDYKLSSIFGKDFKYNRF